MGVPKFLVCFDGGVYYNILGLLAGGVGNLTMMRGAFS